MLLRNPTPRILARIKIVDRNQSTFQAWAGCGWTNLVSLLVSPEECNSNAVAIYRTSIVRRGRWSPAPNKGILRGARQERFKRESSSWRLASLELANLFGA